MTYFASLETQEDRDLNRGILGLMNVLLSPYDPTPIGVAFSLGPNVTGNPLWKLNIDGGWVQGRFAIVGRTFMLEQ